MDGIAKPQASRPAVSRTAPVQTAHKVHKTAEKSKTLMRSVVKKPNEVSRKVVMDGVAKHSSHPAPKAAKKTDPHRIERATAISKSRLISKFGSGVPHAVKPKFDVLPVQAAPKRPEVEAKEALFETLHHAVSPFQHALEHASSHTQAKHKKTRAHHKVAHKLGIKPKVLGAGVTTLSVLLLVGFFAYQNVPNLAMRVAAAKAGVNGSLPSYQPSGFAIQGPIQLSAGQVTVSYKSNSDDRSFSLVQRASEWNSDALLKNYVATDNRPYQTYQDEDKTIYMYDGGNATWVERGVWYQIEGKKALSSDQLLRMAKSL